MKRWRNAAGRFIPPPDFVYCTRCGHAIRVCGREFVARCTACRKWLAVPR